MDLASLLVGSWLLAVVILAIWSFAWKALGLWFSARERDTVWFVVFLIISFFGILEIYYLWHEGHWPFDK